MREKRYREIISFPSTTEMAQAINDISGELRISMGELIRRAIEGYFAREGYSQKENQCSGCDKGEAHEPQLL